MADPTYYPQPHGKPLPYIQAQRGAQYPTSSPTTSTFSHSRTRTSSSNFVPNNSQPLQPTTMNPKTLPVPSQAGYTQGYGYTQPQNPAFASRRTPSTNTFSTTASSGGMPARHPSTTSDLHRTTSSRSGASTSTTSSSSYVARMRRQKATVWCDRAQFEDPRVAAAQRAAKERAAREIHGSNSRLGTSGSGGGGRLGGGKIRHHGKSTLVGYGGGGTQIYNVGGVGGVPLRLSASEVEGESSDEEEDGQGTYGVAGRMAHRRSGSDRSSLSSTRRAQTMGGGAYGRQSASNVGTGSGRYSSGHTPPSERDEAFVPRVASAVSATGMGMGMGHQRTPSANTLEEETPVPGRSGVPAGGEYFPPSQTHSRTPSASHFHPLGPGAPLGPGGEPAPPARQDSKGSNSSNSSGSTANSEKKDSVADLDAARVASNSLMRSTITREKSYSGHNVEELRRRGSVDERTVTMTGSLGGGFGLGGRGRLFVANPDAEEE